MSDERAIESGERVYKMTGKWVTVRSFGTAEQAHLLRLVLERAGIPCVVDNEHTGTALWHAQPAVGGIGLRVPEPFEQQAREVLDAQPQAPVADEGRDGAEDEEEPGESDQDEVYEADEEEPVADGKQCPACHSSDIEKFTWGRRFGQALLVLCAGALAELYIPMVLLISVGAAVYLLITKPDCRCLRCGKRWVVGR